MRLRRYDMILRITLIIFSFLIFSLAINHYVFNKKSINTLPGMPPVNDTDNIYSNANAGMLAPSVLNALPRVYVPNSRDNTVSVIDPATYKVINVFVTGKEPQHIVPSYDLSILWVLNNSGNSLTPIDPKTAKPGKNIAVDDPYNLYYTPDGKFAIAISEGHQRLNFYDSQTMILSDSVPVKCPGVNHMDFTSDGRYAVATCEYSGQLLKLDVVNHKIVMYHKLTSIINGRTSMPQDIRLAPDGKTFYAADMAMNGVYVIDPDTLQEIKFIHTGIGTHSIYPSRDGKFLYVANRGCNSMKLCQPHGPGNISVVDPDKQVVVATWSIPGGGSPDMGNVTENGTELWLSGRFDSEVYVFDTISGVLTHRIPVGHGPHGLTVWPQPGRYSLGHTGNMR